MQEWISDLPLVVWLAIGAGLLGAFALLCYIVAAKGREYGLRFIFSLPFALLLLIATLTLIASGAPFVMELEEAHAIARQNLYWGGALYAASLAIAFLYNAWKGTILLAMPFTLLQGVVALLSALILVYMVLHLMDKKKTARGGR